MKRYTANCFGEMEEYEYGGWVDSNEVEALHAQVTELVRGLPHEEDCPRAQGSVAMVVGDMVFNAIGTCRRCQALALLGES